MTISQIPHVEPGGLISSTTFNKIIDSLQNLQTQIDGLSTGTSTAGLHIDFLDPPGDVRAETQLRIKGGGFAVPAVLNAVSFDNVAVGAFLPGSTDKLLIIDVPAIPSLPKPMTLTVEAGGESASRAVNVVPKPVTVSGQIVVVDTTGPLGTINVGQTYTFQFKLDGINLNVAEQFRITAHYSGAQGASQSAWEQSTTYVGTTGSDHQVTVPSKGTASVGVAVTVPPGATSVNLQVSVTSVNNAAGSSNTSATIPLVVGTAPPQTNPAVELTMGQISSVNVRVATIGTEQGVEVKFGKGGIVRINGKFKEAGTYAFTAEVENAPGEDASVWTIGPLSPASAPEIATQPDTVEFKLTLNPTSAPAQSEQRYLKFTATRQETSGPGQISSYWRFPIRGFT